VPLLTTVFPFNQPGTPPFGVEIVTGVPVGAGPGAGVENFVPVESVRVVPELESELLTYRFPLLDGRDH
jgi:hypothetical protein